MVVGSAIFWHVIARTLERRDAEVRHELSTSKRFTKPAWPLQLSTSCAILQKVVDLSRELSRARYGALGILDHDGLQIEQFITSGIPPEVQARIGAAQR